jgi:hypothetical protein
MLAEMSPRSTAKHVILQHLIEVLKATKSSQTVHSILDRRVAPVLEPAFVELVENLLLFNFPLVIVFLKAVRISARVSVGIHGHLPWFLGMLSLSYVLSILVEADCWKSG